MDMRSCERRVTPTLEDGASTYASVETDSNLSVHNQSVHKMSLRARWVDTFGAYPAAGLPPIRPMALGRVVRFYRPKRSIPLPPLVLVGLPAETPRLGRVFINSYLFFIKF